MLTNALVCVLIISYAFAHFPTVSGTKCTEDGSTAEVQDNINVVLFLAETKSCLNYDADGGLAYLNFSVVGKIKPCTLRPELNLPTMFQKIIRRNPKKECDCRKLLESSIFSLMGWARNVVGMTTAMVSLNASENADSKQVGISYYNYNLQTVDKGSSGTNKQHFRNNKPYYHQPAYMQVRNKDDFGQLPLPVDTNLKIDDLPKLQKEISGNEHDNIPLINVYPAEPKLIFNNINKYHKKTKAEDFINVRRHKRRLIVEPENTQIFEIDTVNEEPNEILDIPSLERSGKPETIWDVLGIMSAIRKSFFVNFMNPMLDPHQRMLDEENGINFDSLGEVRAPSLFELVKNTLTSIQKEAKANHGKGYLLIVMGGSLLNISDPYSDLVQSIKHVRETTDIEHTLLVVTGNCPDGGSHNYTEKQEEFFLPVYAKGPNCEVLSKAQELFDIPVQIKQAIQNNNVEEISALKRKTVNLDKINRNPNLFNLNNYEPNTDKTTKYWERGYKFDEVLDDGNNKDEWNRMRMKRSAMEKLPGKLANNAKMRVVKMPLATVLLIVMATL